MILETEPIAYDWNGKILRSHDESKESKADYGEHKHEFHAFSRIFAGVDSQVDDAGKRTND